MIKKRLVLILHLGLVFVAAFLWMLSVCGKGNSIPIVQVISEAEGLPVSTATNLNPDDLISIRVKSLKWNSSLEWDPSRPGYSTVFCEIRNDTGRQLLVALAAGCVECSADGETWYPFGNHRVEWIQDNGYVTSSMSWSVSFAMGDYEPFYLQPGTSEYAFLFSLDEAFPKETAKLEMIPNGHYRIVFRFCEWIDVDAFRGGRPKLFDFGYYVGYFRVKNGKFIPA